MPLSRFLDRPVPVWALVLSLGITILAAGLTSLALTISSRETAQPCTSIQVLAPRNKYLQGETIPVRVQFTHLLPGCAEVLVLHVHTVRVDANNVALASWNATNDSAKTVEWMPPQGTISGIYSIRACEGPANCASTTVTIVSANAPFEIRVLTPGLAMIFLGTVVVLTTSIWARYRRTL